MQTSGREILITGGAGGIGMALARRFLDAGNAVTVCGRSPERLAVAAAELPALRTIACDLTDPTSVDAMAQRLEAEAPDLDIVINNAAVNHPLDFHDPDAPRKIREEVDANIMGTINASWRLLPLLERQPEACLAIVTSGIAYAPAMGVPGYSLTKAALNSLARSLRMTLHNTSVQVVEIVPPAVDTDMIRDLRCRKMAPATVAEAVLRGFAKDKSEIRMGQTHLTHILNRMWPRSAELVINGSFH
ncbi:MAG: family NAD(P)-dependent oxidoreductase [Acidimicrobiales bacterium]|nr:family NAD(P)-dependent oxidoreductase [Acidimicrobiales bacterium]